MATPPKSASRRGRVSRTPSAWSPTVSNRRPALPYSTNSREIRAAIDSISSLACRRVTPFFIRPTTRRNCCPRGSSVMFGQNGIHASRSSGTLASGGISSRNAEGMTPMTVVGRSLTRIRRPTIPGSPPNLRLQSPAPRRMLGEARSESSPAANVRPSAASAPSVEKKSVVTSPMRSCSGSRSPLSAAVFDQMAPNPVKSRARRRRSASSGPESGARG